MTKKLLFLIDPSADISKYSASSGATNLGMQLARICAQNYNYDITVACNNAENLDEWMPFEFLDYGTFDSNKPMKKSFEKVSDWIIQNDPKEVIIHSHLSTPSVVTYLNDLTKKFPELKIIHTFHTWWNSMMITFTYKNDYSEFFKNPNTYSVFVCVSQMQGYREIYKDLGEYEVIQNASPFEDLFHVGDEEYVPDKSLLRETYGVTWNPGTFNVFVGRLVESKHPVEVMKAILDTSNEKLLIIGNPWKGKAGAKTPSDEVEELVKLYPNRFLHLQGLTTKQVMALVYFAKSFIIYSSHDCCSLAVIESLIANTPVLGWSSSGVTEQLFNVSLCSDPEEFDEVIPFEFDKGMRSTAKSLKLAKLIESVPNKDFSRKLRKVPKIYSFKRFLEEYSKIYKKFL